MEERRVTISCDAAKLGEVLQKLKLSDKFKDTEMEVTLNILDCKENYETLVKSGISWELGEISKTEGKLTDGDLSEYPLFVGLDTKNSIDILSYILRFAELKDAYPKIPNFVDIDVAKILMKKIGEKKDYKHYSDRATSLLGTLPEKLRVELNNNIGKIAYPRYHLYQCLLNNSSKLSPQNLLEMFVKFYR